jgi:hypothetical protein
LLFLLSYMLFWLLAGQQLHGLPEFFYQSWDISQGYAWAMSLTPNRWTLLAGVTVALFNILLAIHLARRHPYKSIAWPALLFVTGSWFLSWKHGFTRADGHVLAFFLTSLATAIALPGLLGLRADRRWYWAGPAVCLLGLYSQRMLINAPQILRQRIADHSQTLANLPKLQDKFIPNAINSALTRAVGNASVDVYNYEQGSVILAGLDYHPRPVIQSYSSYTPSLLKKNLEFLRSSNSADTLILKIQSIDNRHPMLDDSLSLIEIPLRYEYITNVDDYALFKKRSSLTHPDPLHDAPQLLQQTVALGEIIHLPTTTTNALWLSINATPTLWGKVRATIYQPAQLEIVLTHVDGLETRHRIIAPMASTGFLIQPLIQNTRDYTTLLRGDTNSWIEAVRFETLTPMDNLCWDPIAIRLLSLPTYPLNSFDPTKREAQTLFNLRPAKITSIFPEEHFTLDQKPILQVHAPGELQFNIPFGTNTLRASFGLRPASYIEGKTDGVTFVVILRSPGQQEQVLFQRHLDPLTTTSDRGTQTIEIPISNPAIRRTVYLRTLSGPAGNSQWDWSYWTQVRFLP